MLENDELSDSSEEDLISDNNSEVEDNVIEDDNESIESQDSDDSDDLMDDVDHVMSRICTSWSRKPRSRNRRRSICNKVHLSHRTTRSHQLQQTI